MPAGFDGVIGRTLSESTPHFPEPPRPPDGAPDVLVVLLDDLGFAHFGCYGSEIDTPNIDRLAAGGLRYTNFHVTPLCSPTRAALLTGRNHHEVGMRALANFTTGFPHQLGHIAPEAGTIAEVLRDRGYATFALGKWHLCPMADASAAGPFEQWPLGRGFERFYGFLDGETDQFHPDLVADNHRVDPPRSPEDGYHLSEDLVDHAIAFAHDSVSIRPDRPMFTYLAFGATHAPHQAPAEYLEKYRGRFDDGWDAARRRWFARQLDLGVVPAGTELAPRNPGVEAWDDLDDDARRFAARLQEAFAAFLDHTDAQIGRLLDALERLGRLENTLVMVLSDNGASQEGGPTGVLNEWKYFNLVAESPAAAVEHLEDIGGPDSHTNYPWGWAQAGNTPFRWYKQNTHEGGVHVPLVVHWPTRLAGGAGDLRDQFHHVNDLAATIYEAVGIEAPAVLRGVEQFPVTGTSMLYSFDDADAPTAKDVQYFEMMGHRAIWSDGWKAVTRHQAGTPFDDDRWELYHVAEDRSECRDLADAEPERLAALVELWWQQAEAHGVLPLDDRTIELFAVRFGEGVHRADRRYVYRPPVTPMRLSPMPPQAGPQMGGRNWDLDATVARPAGAGGVIWAAGTHSSGFVLHVEGDRLVFDYNIFGEHHVVRSDSPLPEGPSALGVRFRRTEGQAGRATLVVDGEEQGSTDVPFVMHILSSAGPSVGFDPAGGVGEGYRGANPFEGAIEEVVVQLVSASAIEQLADAQNEAASRDAMGRQ